MGGESFSWYIRSLDGLGEPRIAPKSASFQCPLVAAAPRCSPGTGPVPRGTAQGRRGIRGNDFPRDVGRTCPLLRDSQIRGCIQATTFICTVAPLGAGIISFQD